MLGSSSSSFSFSFIKFVVQQFFSSYFLRRQLLIFWLFVFYEMVDFSSADAAGCSECAFFVETFKHGMKQTENAHFGGGNTAWESEKLGKYSKSETRLVEILEYACKKVGSISAEKDDEHKCQSLVERHEELIETWYFHKQTSDPDFYTWLCIITVRVCCPENTFGPNCDRCPGEEASKPCSGRGKCHGAGTRSGSGKCKCDKGYQGNLCRKCSSNYFMAQNGDNNDTTHIITCERCDAACKGGCTKAGPSGCVQCKEGWTLKQDVGCEDVNECETSPAELCNNYSEKNEECVNTIGSYECRCKEGYKRGDDEKCVIDVSAARPVAVFLGLYADQVLRYCAMLGLAVAVVVIAYRRSLGLALLFLFTLAVIGYIETEAVTEYLRNLTKPLNLTMKNPEL